MRRALLLTLLAPLLLLGPPPQATAQTAEDEPTGRMILLLDASGSMAEPAGDGVSRIEAARSALALVVAALPTDAEVGLRVFGASVFSRGDRGACTDSQLVVDPGTDNRDDLAAALDDYRPYGETPIPHALEQAAADLGPEGPRSIVLVSDGESTCAPDPCQVAADIVADGIDLRINVVGLSVSGAARSQLQCIAERGNGQYYDADSADEIVSRLVRVAERAARPFTLGGEPIDGGPVDRPEPVTVGDWHDVIGPRGAERSFTVTRETAGTTLRVSAVMQGDGSTSDALQMELFDPQGDRCDASTLSRNLDLRDLVGVQVAATADPDAPDGGPCAQPGDYRVTVRRGSAAERATAYGLRVSEEPVLAAAVGEPTATAVPELGRPDVAGRPTEALGGTSFADATPVGPGRWSSTIVPGEALLYRLPLEHGQSLRVAARFPRVSDPVRERLEAGFPAQAQLTLLNPMRATLAAADAGAAYGRPDGSTLLDATGTVDRASLTTSSAVGSAGGSSDLSMAGDYYVMVSVMAIESTVELPFTLDLEVVGTPTPAPSYVDGLTWSVATGVVAPPEEESAPGAPAPGPAPEADDAESTLVVPLAVGGGVLVVLVLTLAGWSLHRRRGQP